MRSLNLGFSVGCCFWGPTDSASVSHLSVSVRLFYTQFGPLCGWAFLRGRLTV